MKPRWQKPQLIVLVRQDSGIAVLDICKNNPTVMGHIAPDSVYWICAKVIPYCTNEACNAWTNS
jgi:hypothetical protein